MNFLYEVIKETLVRAIVLKVIEAKYGGVEIV